jgi:peptidoglycan-N-acetylmuramic acid deacetylase
MAKKKKGLSPTFKAGLILVVVMVLIWAVMSSDGKWMGNKDEVLGTQVITTKEETMAQGDSEPSAPAETTQETPTEVVVEVPTTEPEVVTDITDDVEVVTEPPVNLEDFDKTKDLSGFSDVLKSWSFKRNSEHKPALGYEKDFNLATYDAFGLAPTEDQVVYLTFDEGYENGHTSKILDILSENDVQATFFVTEPYIRSNPELVKRMKDEGHIVGNHSKTHPSLPGMSYDAIVGELEATEASMEKNTGYKMDLFMRPPKGEYSEKVLYIARQLGYKTIFWSMAYVDWDVNNQPGREAAYEHVMSNYHPGAIILLHAVSESNTEALEDILKDLMGKGYRFGSLYEIPSKYTTQ